MTLIQIAVLGKLRKNERSGCHVSPFGCVDTWSPGDPWLLWLELNLLRGCTQWTIRRGWRTDARYTDAKEIRPAFIVLPKCLAWPDRIELAIERNRIMIVDEPQRSADGERIEFGKDHGMTQRAGNFADIEILGAVHRHSAGFRSSDKCHQQDGILVSVQSVFTAWFQAHHLAGIQIARCVVFEEGHMPLERMDRDLAGCSVTFFENDTPCEEGHMPLERMDRDLAGCSVLRNQ